jgi:DNA-directed RNA polymerase subunit M/transcription elongation factor TFIIS
VPHAALADAVSEAVAAALEVHRAELVELVEVQVEAELERLAGELVAEAIARRNGHADSRGEGSQALRAAPVASVPEAETAKSEKAEELRRCSRCGELRPRSAFGVDRRTADGLRRSCRSCRSEHEYRPRARRARREKASPAARVGPRDEEDPRPAPGHAENGRRRPSAPERCASCGAELDPSSRQRRYCGIRCAAQAASRAPRPRPRERSPETDRVGERTPTIDEWLVESGFAERNGRGLVATELGAELASVVFG